MMSNSHPQVSKYSEHNVFSDIPIRPNQEKYFTEFLTGHDLSQCTIEALFHDLRKFAKWFTSVNREPWNIQRVTARDVMDFREYLRIEKQQANSTINRNIASLKKYFTWLITKEYIQINPTSSIKELRKQPLAPQGLARSDVRKIFREVELRGDIRAKAIFSLMLYTGARLSDVASLELCDINIGDRSGTIFYRYGKGSKQRVVPLPLQSRKSIAEYLEKRLPMKSDKVFIGERGPLNRRGIQSMFERYRVLTGIENLHCHILRHTFSHTFLSQNGNLVQLAQILGHENLNTTAIYTQNSVEQLSDAAEKVVY